MIAALSMLRLGLVLMVNGSRPAEWATDAQRCELERATATAATTEPKPKCRSTRRAKSDEENERDDDSIVYDDDESDDESDIVYDESSDDDDDDEVGRRRC